jgi:hypothetical protein
MPQGGLVQSAPQAKTVIAQNPFPGGIAQAQAMAQQMAQQQQQGGPPPQGGFTSASPMQKTIVAGMAPQIVGGQLVQPGMMPGQGMQPGMMPGQGMQPGMMPGQGMQPGMMPQGPGMPGHGMPQGMPQGTPQGGYPQGGAPNKTVMLQASEGVVSVARSGGNLSPIGNQIATAVRGASATYWIICLLVGIAVGVGGYLVVLEL